MRSILKQNNFSSAQNFVGIIFDFLADLDLYSIYLHKEREIDNKKLVPTFICSHRGAV